MNKALANTIQFITGKDNLQATTQKEVQELVAEYPYFAPAQLVYAAKLRFDNSYQTQTQIQKAGLFFNNARWLQYQLMDISSTSYAAVNDVINTSIEIQDSEPKTEEVIIAEVPVIVDINQEEKVDFISTLNIPTVEDVKNIMSGIDEQTIQVEDEETINVSIDTTKTEEVVELNNQINTTEDNIEAADIQNIKIVSEIPAAENDIHAQIAALKANWHKSTEESVTNVDNNLQESLVAEKSIEAKVDLPDLRADWDKPKEDFSNALLPFETEPYYTIDYFASQGIKFDYSKEPHDKLTTKMLKFTDWLKKMKTTKPENIIAEDDPELEKAIVNIAATSNQSKEVVTETMAEIFAKQGKKEKAIQLYIKLSFLIPDKSTYFATKIKELKGI